MTGTSTSQYPYGNDVNSETRVPGKVLYSSLVILSNALWCNLQFIFHSKYILLFAIRLGFWRTKKLYKIWGGYHLAETPRGTENVGSDSRMWVNVVRVEKSGAYRIVASSFFPGHQEPAAIKFCPPGRTAHEMVRNPSENGQRRLTAATQEWSGTGNNVS